MNDQPFQIVVYPGREREPRAALYRIVVTGDGSRSLAWILLHASEQSGIDPRARTTNETRRSTHCLSASSRAYALIACDSSLD